MTFSELVENKNNFKFKNNDICTKLFKGACVKIKNSKKTFQIVGLNPKSKVCWIREWPFSFEDNKTFSLEINQITIQTFCSDNFNEN